MKITAINVTNVLGARSVNVHLNTPISVFCAQNRNGKTSLLEAVRMAMRGEPARGVNHKKNYNQLITEGASGGQAAVETVEQGELWMMLPTGKGVHAQDNAALPYVLDPTRLGALTDKERKATLFNLLGLKLTPAAVKEKMQAHGLDMAKAERVLPLLRTGFEDASAHAAEQATQCKGAWKNVTGEQWGSEKAVDWKAQAATFDQAELDALLAQAADADQAMMTATLNLGSLTAQHNQFLQQAGRVTELKAKSERLDRINKKLETDEAELADLQGRLATLKASEETQDAKTCPGCGAMLLLKDGQLVHVDPSAARGTDDDLARIPAIEQAIHLCRNAIANDRRDLAEAEAAKEQLKEIEATTATVKQSDIDTAKAHSDKLKADRALLTTRIDALTTAKRAATDSEANTKKAAGHHADIMAWLAIATALSPNGIPGQMVSDGLKPFAARLAQSREDTGWPLVAITQDMAITYGGRAYQLLSESEKWRADAMLAEAISHVSGLKLLLLDRFDCLDLPGRGEALAWLDTLAINNEVDTVLVGATLKSAQANWAPSTSAYWISNGVCQAEQQELAAA